MATTNKRPGGLTALAVVNFILLALSVLGTLGIAAAQFLPDNPNATEAQRAQLDAIRHIGTAQFALYLLAPVIVGGALLLLSGIGYLKQKKFLGRTLGNVYALLSIVHTVPTILWAPQVLGGGFHMTTLIGFVYPALTLILLNTTFKEDLTN